MLLYSAIIFTVLLLNSHQVHGTSLAELMFDGVMTENGMCIVACGFGNLGAIFEDINSTCTTQINNLIEWAEGLGDVFSDVPTGDQLQDVICDAMSHVDGLMGCALPILTNYCGQQAVDWINSMKTQFFNLAETHFKCNSPNANSLLHCMLALFDPLIQNDGNTTFMPCIHDLVGSLENYDFNFTLIYDNMLKFPRNSGAFCSVFPTAVTCMMGDMDNTAACSEAKTPFEGEVDPMFGYVGCGSGNTDRDALSCIANPNTIETIEKTCINDALQTIGDSDIFNMNSTQWCGISSFVSCFLDIIIDNCPGKWTHNKMNSLLPTLMDFINYKGQCNGTQENLVIGGCKCTFSDYKITTDDSAPVTCDGSQSQNGGGGGGSSNNGGNSGTGNSGGNPSTNQNGTVEESGAPKQAGHYSLFYVLPLLGLLTIQ